ncbi:MAG: ribonuclease activity regulator RraA [Candidatus Latescibacterota bacterium]|nr:ribonuclease activity regulator RraA [Candidatus Latescibacterota bacterium]
MSDAPIETPDIERPPKELIEQLKDIGSATAAGELKRLGIEDPTILGPVTHTPGKCVVGPALTLQFLPKREDVYNVDEYSDPEKQLHRHVLYHTQPGDVVVVDARGSMKSGCFGNMMLTFFQGRGGIGVVIDGCIRDFPIVKHDLDLGLWLRGVTPNFHTQTDIYPASVNVPIGVNDTLVVPGDIIVADDDGVVVVPAKLALELAEAATSHAEWEDFSRMKLLEGGHLRKYYPLSEVGRAEYEEWKRKRGK